MNKIKNKLAKSFEEEYFFEALFILFSLNEHIVKKEAKKYTNKRLSFKDAIDTIYKEQIITEDFKLKLHIWREMRNDFVHKLVNSEIDEEKLRKMTLKGNEILEILEKIN